MTPAEQRAELLAAVDAARRSRDAHRAAAQADDETVMLLERVLDATAAVTPLLRVQERAEWLPVKLAARALGIDPMAARRRAQRGLHTGRGRKVGGRLQLRMSSQPEAGDG